MAATTDLYTLDNNHPQRTRDKTNSFPNSSLGSCAPPQYQQENRLSDVVIGNNSYPSNSIIHPGESSTRGTSNGNHNENQCGHNFGGRIAGISTDNENRIHQVPSIHHDALDNDFKPNLSSQSMGLMTSFRVPDATTSSPLIKPNDRLALSSVINTNEIQPNLNASVSNFSPDLTLDEDAPHDEDDSGTDNESTYISLPIITGGTYPGSSIDSNLHSHHDSTCSTLFHTWTPAQDPSPQAENIPLMPPPTRPASRRKRKRDSSGPSQSAKPPASSAPSRSKSAPRVKTAEQLATEALIEQQNPHATKNELRSLKLRALHAVRIAERELNMPEAEKQRRLRLREYVRHKRAEERSQKNSASKQASSGRQSKAGSGAHSTSSSENNADDRLQTGTGHVTESGSQDVKPAEQVKSEADLANHHNASLTTVSQQFTAFDPSYLPLQPASNPNTSTLSGDNGCQPESTLPMDSSTSDDRPRQSKPKASQGGQKAPKRKSVSQARLSAVSLEAEIKNQNPNASPTELKSLKLRALHAGRIAEREQNMSEKEKLRRHKLREYMRRRRDEERAEKSNDSPDLNAPIDVCPTSDSHVSYRGSFDCSMNSGTPLHTNGGAMPALGGPPLGSEETNAKEQMAAFSMMEMTHNFHDQFRQSHQAHRQPDFHVNSLFHMPMPQSSLEVTPPYDRSMQTTYSVADTWSQIPAPDPHMAGDDVAQKALHAAIQEAVYMKPHHDRPLGTGEPNHEHFPTNGEPIETHRLPGMEREQVRGDDILGIIRARELAVIAAAAAEVEHAQQMSSSTSSHLH